MKKLLIALLIYNGFIYSAQIVLIDGTKINGEIINSTDEELQLKVSYSEDLITINRSQVLDIIFSESSNRSILTQNTGSLRSQNTIVDFSETANRVERAGLKLIDFKS
tara:strand:+ start:1658 stop:1981 length:324 start_codon:yes stop_codon:yes gene_type:complete